MVRGSLSGPESQRVRSDLCIYAFEKEAERVTATCAFSVLFFLRVSQTSFIYGSDVSKLCSISLRLTNVVTESVCVLSVVFVGHFKAFMACWVVAPDARLYIISVMGNLGGLISEGFLSCLATFHSETLTFLQQLHAIK